MNLFEMWVWETEKQFFKRVFLKVAGEKFHCISVKHSGISAIFDFTLSDFDDSMSYLEPQYSLVGKHLSQDFREAPEATSHINNSHVINRGMGNFFIAIFAVKTNSFFRSGDIMAENGIPIHCLR